jgi:hypothetical protein
MEIIMTRSEIPEEKPNAVFADLDLSLTEDNFMVFMASWCFQNTIF